MKPTPGPASAATSLLAALFPTLPADRGHYSLQVGFYNHN